MLKYTCSVGILSPCAERHDLSYKKEIFSRREVKPMGTLLLILSYLIEILILIKKILDALAIMLDRLT